MTCVSNCIVRKMKLQLFVCIVIVLLIQFATAGMVGGWSPVENVNSSSFQRIVKIATEAISDKSNAAYLMRPIEILSAEQQVVAGMNYRFTMRIGATNCRKNKSDEKDINSCELKECGRIEKCDVVVWDKPWEENGTKVTKHSCKKEPKSC